MKILVAGGSGFIGQELIHSFKDQHQITVLGRNRAKLEKLFSFPIQIITWETLDQLKDTFDVIINLSGSNIADKRWNTHVKKELIDSRVQSIQALTTWVKTLKYKPHWINANAIGIYGLQKNGEQRTFDENTEINFEHPTDFLSVIGIKWQQALQPAMKEGIPVTTTRFGVVLKKGQGMLKKLTFSFSLGLGSIIGNGKQIISWVHIDDLIKAIDFLMNRPHLTGPFNITSPHPVSQEEFAKTLAKTMHRPLFLKMPASIVKMMFGEMGEQLLLQGQRVIPSRLLEEGFQFNFPHLSNALSKDLK